MTVEPNKASSLTSLVEFLNREFAQQVFETSMFDLKALKFKSDLQPKYLYRGENARYDRTTTSLSRLLSQQIFGSRDIAQLMFVQMQLYLFLRESIWRIPTIQATEHGN